MSQNQWQKKTILACLVCFPFTAGHMIFSREYNYSFIYLKIICSYIHNHLNIWKEESQEYCHMVWYGATNCPVKISKLSEYLSVLPKNTTQDRQTCLFGVLYNKEYIDHNTMSQARARTWTARSRVECTNHEATTPPIMLMVIFGKGHQEVRGVCTVLPYWQDSAIWKCIATLIP